MTSPKLSGICLPLTTTLICLFKIITNSSRSFLFYSDEKTTRRHLNQNVQSHQTLPKGQLKTTQKTLTLNQTLLKTLKHKKKLHLLQNQTPTSHPRILPTSTLPSVRIAPLPIQIKSPRALSFPAKKQWIWRRRITQKSTGRKNQRIKNEKCQASQRRPLTKQKYFFV